MGARIKSIDALLSEAQVKAWVGRHGREPVLAALRGAADDVRESARRGSAADTQEALDAAVMAEAAARLTARAVS